jgi:two-component system, chemotaxis family, chemotaxis protein CheY
MSGIFNDSRKETEMKFDSILIVDDSSTSRMIIRKCFNIAGFSESLFLYAENGIEALSILNENTVDLIVTDINMPKMDGENFVKKLKADKMIIPVIVITGVGSLVLEEELRKAGIYGIIRKPVSPAKIIELIGGGQ